MAARARRGGGGGGSSSSPQAFHELGVRGRKTGVFLPDRGERDEHGMQPLDSIFSSPRRPSAKSARSQRRQDDSGSEDMDIASSAGPGPRTLLKSQRNVQIPIPRSRSPVKTNLKSPARKNPHLDRFSSPTRGSIVEDRDVTVTRKLDFANKSAASRSRTKGAPARVNGNIFEEEEEEDDETPPAAGDGDAEELFDDAPEPMVEYDDRDDESFGAAEEEEEEPAPLPIRSGKKSQQKPDSQAGRASKKRRPGRPSGNMGDIQEEDEERGYDDPEPPRETKRQRTARSPPPNPRGRGRPPKEKSASMASGTKPSPKQPTKRGRKPRGAARAADADGVGEASFMALQRGPPMPKSRGLVSVRRDPDTILQTRSGRHSFRPLSFWRGEQVVQDEVEPDDDGNALDHDFVLPSMKEIVRVPEDHGDFKRPGRKGPRPKAKSKTQTAAAAVEREPEEWEINPGVMSTEVVLWSPEHEFNPPGEDEPVHVVEEQVAISAEAVETKDIRDATFRFAKTLTMPFMGAGIVELPPGAEKRPKNSRKMHMVFFVHTGKVLVTVNDAQFRLSSGGTWFVPRGNYYSITNDYDDTARVFFAQGCEVAAPPPEEYDEE